MFHVNSRALLSSCAKAMVVASYKLKCYILLPAQAHAPWLTLHRRQTAHRHSSNNRKPNNCSTQKVHQAMEQKRRDCFKLGDALQVSSETKRGARDIPMQPTRCSPEWRVAKILTTSKLAVSACNYSDQNCPKTAQH
jgi:hypothetical protein